MSVGVMKDYKLKRRNLRASHTLGGCTLGRIDFRGFFFPFYPHFLKRPFNGLLGKVGR